ncbi:putative nuclease HARBI1, partial [Bienertia sinuspersici]
RGANPRGPREIFNRAHSSLRSCIERAFGILKARWKLLQKLPRYSPQEQNRIVCASFALHNYIRLSKVPDPAFVIIDNDPNFIPPEASSSVTCESTREVQGMSTNEMTRIRNDITNSLMEARGRRQRRRIAR